jgi:hypothetical protein
MLNIRQDYCDEGEWQRTAVVVGGLEELACLLANRFCHLRRIWTRQFIGDLTKLAFIGLLLILKCDGRLR